MKNLPNNTFFGFVSVADFIYTFTGFKYKAFIAISSIIGAISSFITGYIYKSAEAVYFLLFLLFCDLITACYRAWKTNTFTSKRLPRVLILMLSYCLALALAWNASIYVPLLSWLPGFLYAGFVSVLFVSNLENLVYSKLLPGKILSEIKDKINIKNLFKKNENEDGNKDKN